MINLKLSYAGEEISSAISIIDNEADFEHEISNDEVEINVWGKDQDGNNVVAELKLPIISLLSALGFDVEEKDEAIDYGSRTSDQITHYYLDGNKVPLDIIQYQISVDIIKEYLYHIQLLQEKKEIKLFKGYNPVEELNNLF